MSTPSQGSKPSRRWQPPSLEEMQAALPQYQFESLLGRGGMGAVYKARQLTLDRWVAIKVLPGDLIDDVEADFAGRFKNEARTMARFSHAGIVKVYDFGETRNALLYIVMEFINGTDVAQMILSQGRLAPDHALAVTAHVCDALAYAHKHGVIHRDIKPANILVNQEGTVKVADFGLAKQSDAGRGLTKTNTAMGTPDFLAPEAFSPGTVVDSRADLYAVGVMLYQMLTGEVPRGMWSLPSGRTACDPRFDQIILKAMQTDREMRYQHASEIRRDLDAIFTSAPAKSGVQGPPASAAEASSASAPPENKRRTHVVRPKKEKPPAAKKKSSALLIYGIAFGVIGLLVGLFVLSGGLKTGADTAAAGASSSPTPSSTPARPDKGRDLAERLRLLAAPLEPGAINALANVKFPGDKRYQWRHVGTGIAVKPVQDPGPYKGMVELPAPPARDYAVEAWFTNTPHPFNDVGLCLPVGGERRVTCWIWSRDGGWAGLGKVDGMDPQQPAIQKGCSTSFQLKPGEIAFMRAEVRRLPGSVDVQFRLNGTLVAHYNGPTSRLTLSTAWIAGWDAELPFIGGREVTFHRVTMQPLGSAEGAKPAASAWQAVFTEEMRKTPQITVLPDGWLRVKDSMPGPTLRDVALRAKARLGSSPYIWPLLVRDKQAPGSLSHYGVMIDGRKIALHRRDMAAGIYSADDKDLAAAALPRVLGPNDEFDLEINCLGDRFTVAFDGKILIDVRDTFCGGIRTRFAGELKNLEWRALGYEPR